MASNVTGCSSQQNKKSPRQGRSRPGTALLELAFVMPILALLLLGVFDLGRAYAEQVAVVAAARQGARAAMRSPDNASVQAVVINALNGMVAADHIQTPIVITRDLGSKIVTVGVHYQHDILFGLVPNVGNGSSLGVSGPLHLYADATMPYVEDPSTYMPTNTPVSVATNTPVPLTGSTNTAVPADTYTPVPAAGPTNTAVPLPTNTAVPVDPGLPTNTPVPLPTNTPGSVGGGCGTGPRPPCTPAPVTGPTNTAVPLPTNTAVPVDPGLPTNTPVPLWTNTPVPRPTNTPVPVPTNTPVPRPTNTPVPRPTQPL